VTPVSHGLRKAGRTVLQLIAAGALTALVTALAGGLSPTVEGVVVAGWASIVAFAQNALEQAGTIPTILPTPVTPHV
jgi:hypothetical protein